MNSKATRIALVTSLASLVLCFTMLMGTTLAWFVDRVENTNNRIEAGNLEVDLLMYNRATGNYVSIAELGKDTDIFALANSNSARWSPSVSKTVYFAVRNTGTLPVKYKANMKVSNKGLAGALTYKIRENVGAGALVISDEAQTSGNERLTGGITPITKGERTLNPVIGDPENPEEAGETHYYALTVSMDPGASTSYQNQSVEIDIAVEATQLNANESSNGEPIALSEIPNDEKVETLSGTSWKLKAEVADYAFLEEKEEESDDAVFPDESIISADDTEYPLSALSIVSLGETKLLMAAPPDENEEEESVKSVFVYYPKEEESKADDEAASPHGWYLIGYEDIQKLLADDNATVENFTESAERIEDAEKLPIITFAESDSDILKNKKLIDWLYSNAEMQISEDGVSE